MRGSVEEQEGRRQWERRNAMITTKEEEGKEETPELPPSMLFTQYLSLFHKLQILLQISTSHVNSRMQPWLKTLVAAKHHQPNKTPLPGNYSPASWGRRRTVLRSAACRPAGAPSPPSWFRKAGRRRKHVRKPVTRTEMFDTIKPLTTERWKQGKFSCFV